MFHVKHFISRGKRGMRPIKWTDAQRAAIEARNDTVLVSAAAGSGKTAVLVERVTGLVRKGGDVTRMLIVTFTRAAAAEMKERITAALENDGADAHMRLQALRVSRAKICTIHVFCQSVIREHFEAVGVDPMARIGDSAILGTLLKTASDDALEAAYAAPDENQKALFARYSSEQVAAMAEQARRFLLAMAEPEEWIEKQVSEISGDLLSHPLMDALYDECALHLECAGAKLCECDALMNLPGAPLRYAQTLDVAHEILEEMRVQAANKKLLAGDTSFPTFKGGKKAEDEEPEITQQLKDQYKEFRGLASDARGILPSDPIREKADINDTILEARALCELALKIDEKFRELKNAKDLLDYDDLQRLCYAALKNETVRMEVSGAYDAIFVDEYQDVSGIQEAIIQSVHQKNTLFLVGDVKQSIYRFRLADPMLFLNKYHQFSNDSEAPRRRILLSQNFRSDKNVLSSVNLVFQGAMREHVTEIDYDEEAALKPGENSRTGEPVELHILQKSDQEEGKGEQLTKGYLYEAQIAAKRIRQLVSDAVVHEKEGERKLKFRDIVILMRKAAQDSGEIAAILQSYGIPVYSDADEKYYELPEVVDILNLLRVLDNPYQDMPLLAALCCPAFGFTKEELARARLVEKAPGAPFYQAFFSLALLDSPLGLKAKEAARRLDQWRFLSEHCDVETLVRTLLDETGAYMLAGAMEDGEARQANLRLLCERAAAAPTLHDFLDNVEKVRLTDDATTAKTLSDNENVVRIMTMHKSKGLEFPCVILMGLAKEFKDISRDELLLDLNMGAALTHIDPEARTTRDTALYNALLCQAKKKQRAEEARLLYVAMTRAKERLILLASPRRVQSEFKFWRLPKGDAAAGSAKCMLDWIGQAVYPGLDACENQRWTADNGSVFDIFWDNADALDEEAPEEKSCSPQMETGETPALIRDMLTRAPVKSAPLKTSVSAIAKRFRTEEDEEETPASKIVSRETLEDRPRFMLKAGLTAAERGSAVHKALGLIGYETLRPAFLEDVEPKVAHRVVRAALNELLDSGRLSHDEREAVRTQDITAFFGSELGRRALLSKTVKREWAFNLRADENTIVQGVLDLCFLEDGQWTLVDYKTDRDVGDALVCRYGDQMRWYARALRELTGLPVRESRLYAIRTGASYPVPPASVRIT